MSRWSALLVFMMLFPAVTLAGDVPAVPALIEQGFAMYAKEGPKAAIENWTRGSALEASKEALSQAN